METTLYHRVFPEFTLGVDGASDIVATNEEWTRGEIRTDNNMAGHYKLYYHQILLNRTRFVVFDDRKKSMVAPDWEPRGRGRFYFYHANSLPYALQIFSSRREHGDDSVELRIRGNGNVYDEARAFWPRGMRIPVLKPGELEGFLGPKENRIRLDPSRDETQQYKLFLRNQLDFEEWRMR